MARFHTLDVVDVRRETRDAVVVTLRPQPEDAALFDFTQGQYLTFRRKFDDDELRRSYSICAGRGEGHLRVGIKRVDGGAFSTWANEELKAGAILEAMPPMGRFFTPIEPDAAKNYLGFAGGSGITPLLSIIKTVLAAEPRSTFTLVYANRQISSIMFREELEDLKNRHLGRLSIVHVLESEAQDIDLFTGRVDAAKCAALFRTWIDLPSVTTAFICGPEPMMLAIAGALREHGLADEQIKFELFASGQPGRAKKRVVSDAASTSNSTRGDGHPRRRHPHLPHAEGGHQPARRRAGGEHRRPLRLQGRRLLHLPRQGAGGRDRDGRQPRARGLRGPPGLRAHLPVLPAERQGRRQLRPVREEPCPTDTETMPIEDYLAQGGVLTSPRTSPPATAASSCA